MTLRAELAAATDTLTRAGVDSPRHDAEALAAHVLDVRRLELALVQHLGGPAGARFRDLVARRAARVPLQHLVGSTGFRTLDLQVGAGVFVPRPETECVAGWAVDTLRREWPAPAGRADGPLAVDLCAGSGAIGLSLAHELPHARVHAVERDPDAFGWLQRNALARAAAGDPPVTLHLCDAATALPELDGQVDLVASNPPYVAEDERAHVAPEVLHHDPAVALWAGADGLSVIRVVELTARRLLRPDGVVVVEHSDRQGRTVPAVFAAAGAWTQVRGHRDLAGRDRFVTARRAAR